jgi:hypothetical protein
LIFIPKLSKSPSFSTPPLCTPPVSIVAVDTIQAGLLRCRFYAGLLLLPPLYHARTKTFVAATPMLIHQKTFF